MGGLKPVLRSNTVTNYQSDCNSTANNNTLEIPLDLEFKETTVAKTPRTQSWGNRVRYSQTVSGRTIRSMETTFSTRSDPRKSECNLYSNQRMPYLSSQVSFPPWTNNMMMRQRERGSRCEDPSLSFEGDVFRQRHPEETNDFQLLTTKNPRILLNESSEHSVGRLIAKINEMSRKTKSPSSPPLGPFPVMHRNSLCKPTTV